VSRQMDSSIKREEGIRKREMCVNRVGILAKERTYERWGQCKLQAMFCWVNSNKQGFGLLQQAKSMHQWDGCIGGGGVECRVGFQRENNSCFKQTNEKTNPMLSGCSKTAHSEYTHTHTQNVHPACALREWGTRAGVGGAVDKVHVHGVSHREWKQTYRTERTHTG
jgi:hypothetical protein